MSTTSQAAVLCAYNAPLEIRTYPVADKAGPGEAIVRVEMAGICGTDVHLWKGELTIPIPVILGHETVGRIIALGAGLEKDWRGNALAVGDRVTWASSIVCGECYYCRQKRQPTRCVSRKAYGISYNVDDAPHLRGGYAQYIHLRAGSSLFRLPDSLPTEAVLGAGCALTTALHGLERCTVTPGDVVVVQGTGPVGMAALAVAIQAGAEKVIVTGGPEHRLKAALEFGAYAAISIDEHKTPEARKAAVLAAAGPFGADVVVECVGHPSAVPEGIEMCRDGGKYAVLGQYADAGSIMLNPHIITRKQLEVRGSWGFEPRHTDMALRLLDSTHWKEKFAAQITHRFPLAEVNEALETVSQWRSSKAVIVP
jgi:threonine dehydrogenase-like Zn-dependent dehydrogenase